jgi:hypothetical protein
MDETEPSTDRKHRWFKRRWIWTPIILVILAAAGLVGIKISQSTSPIPKTIKQQIGFSIYYPQKLPTGFSVDKSSWRIPEQNVVLLTLLYQGKKLVISQQPKPVGFDIDNFYQTKVANLAQFLAPAGQSAVGTISNGNGFGSVVTTDNTWIILSAPKGIEAGQLREVIQGLSKPRS